MKPTFVPKLSNPCSQDWSAMRGDEKRRFCDQCQLHVHNLSAMTKDERMELLSEGTEERCISYLRPRFSREVGISRWLASQARSSSWPSRWASAVATAFVSFFFTSCRMMGGIPIPPPPGKNPVSNTQPRDFGHQRIDP